MSIYSTGVETYRDTTRWLAALVPVTALATAGVVLGPRLFRGTAGGAGGWWAGNWPLALALLVAVAAVAAILASAVSVLSVEAREIGALAAEGDPEGRVAEAIGAGALLPHFFAKEDFDAAMARHNARVPGDAAGAPTDAEVEALNDAVTALRDWSMFREVRDRFRVFVRVFVAAVAVLGVAGVAALSVMGGTVLDAPTPVTVQLSPEGAAALAEATGCTGADVAFVAVGGTLTSPVLDPTGTDCRYGATWRPRPGEAEITFPPG